MKTILVLLAAVASLAAQGFDLTLPLPVPSTNVVGQKIVHLRQPLLPGSPTTPTTTTNLLPVTARSITFTNLDYGTNTFTLVWFNGLGDSPPGAPLVVVQVPRPPAAPQAPPPFGEPTIVLK